MKEFCEFLLSCSVDRTDDISDSRIFTFVSSRPTDFGYFIDACQSLLSSFFLHTIVDTTLDSSLSLTEFNSLRHVVRHFNLEKRRKIKRPLANLLMG